MKTEADFKKKFKNSIKKQGGYSLSLAAPMIPGLPDLYVIMAGYLPVLLEAKWLRTIPRDKFKRKLRMSAMQAEIIRSCHNITRYNALGLIGFKWHDTIHAVLVPYDNPNFESITQDFTLSCSYTTLYNGVFDIEGLFFDSPIPKLQQQQKISLHSDTNHVSVEL